ncbi:hypothetical protein J5I95_18150 [Candidatus Poribacteria bacterium]|nr:hypothetical protein [Candidatus Poribacteria bacterium]
MEKFEVNESVVVKHDDNGTSSGKVIRELGDDRYLVFFIRNGWESGEFNASQLTSFGTALFLVTESYEAQQSELAEVAAL